jgi:polyhydroxybutyrate depolymerase
MTYRLACDAADVFAAVAPVAANLSVDLGQRCAPTRAVPLTIINGTDDPIVPWNGGAIKVLWAARGVVLSAQATVARWMELDKCDALHEVGGVKDAVADDGTTLLLRTAECADRGEINLYEVRGGGHTWPGGEVYLSQMVVGRVSHELNANETVWRFFTRHSLQ